MTREKLLQLILVFYGLALIAAIVSLVPSKKFPHAGKKRGSGRLAVVHVYGAIHGATSSSSWGSEDADDIARTLHRYSEQDDIKAIVLRINSPGGTVGAVQEIYAEVMRCKAKGKKVVASLGDVAASGGYYLASSADKIVSNPGTITGSIGVILEFGNLETLFQKIGVRLEVIKSGAHKDIGSPARALTPEERQMLQASINDAYDQFVTAVSSGRGLPADQVRPLADGRIFTGAQALRLKLVDQLGDFQDAQQKAIELAGLPEHPSIVSDESNSLASMMRSLSSRFGSGWESLRDAWSGPSVEYRWR